MGAEHCALAVVIASMQKMHSDDPNVAAAGLACIALDTGVVGDHRIRYCLSSVADAVEIVKLSLLGSLAFVNGTAPDY